jgi:hypothetical protein
MDVSGNNINGTIPNEVSGLTLLTFFSVSTNFLTGVVSYFVFLLFPQFSFRSIYSIVPWSSFALLSSA